MKKLARLSVFLIALRWAALFWGTLFVGLKAGGTHTGSVHSLLWQHNTLFIGLLFAFEIVLSILQMKAQREPSIAWTIAIADAVCGVFLIVGWGPEFFFLAALLPVLESFLISDFAGLGMIVASFIILAPFLIQETFSAGSDASKLPVRFLGGEFFISIAVFWLFLLAKEQEFDVERLQMKAQEEKKYLQGELETSQRELEKLLRERVATQNELENLKLNVQTSISTGEEEASAKIQKAERGEEEAQRKLSDFSAELEESRKERQNLNFLMETSGQMHESLQMDETLNAVVDTLRKVLPSQTYLIFLLEDQEKKQRLYTEIAASPYSDYFRNYNVELGEGVVGWVAREGSPAIIENASLRTADGHEFTTLITNERSAMVAPLLKKDGTPLGVIYLGQSQPHAYSWQDMNVLLRFIPHIQTALSKARRYHEAISQGILDSLTSLYNQAYFNERLAEEVKRASRYQLSLSLIYLEIDHFEKLASQVDENTVKQIVKEVSEMLKGYLREVDVLARIGEGKFAILLLQAEKSSAVLISERIRLAIEMRMFGEAGKKIKLTASIGVTGYVKAEVGKLDHSTAKSKLLSKCSQSLQEAISQGGNKTCMAA